MYDMNAFSGGLPSFGGMAGPQGFAGDMPGYGMDPTLDPRKKRKGGMFGGPLGQAAPMFGLAGMLSGSGMLPFLLGGLGGGGLFHLLKK